MLWASSANRSASQVDPNRNGSTVTTVNHRECVPHGASGMMVIPGTDPSARS